MNGVGQRGPPEGPSSAHRQYGDELLGSAPLAVPCVHELHGPVYEIEDGDVRRRADLGRAKAT